MPLTVSSSSKHAIKIFVMLGPLTVMFEESFCDVFLLLIYISIQCILEAFSSSESQRTIPDCAAPLDANPEPSGSVCSALTQLRPSVESRFMAVLHGMTNAQQ